MKGRPLTPPVTAAKRRALRRRRSAGGTMFVVAMTLAVLSTIGAWALQSAALEVRMAGYERQSAQTHYLAEYGVIAVMEQLQSNNPQTATVLGYAVTGVSGVHAACTSVPCINFACPLSVLSGPGCSEITSLSNPAKSCWRWEGTGGALQVPLDVGDGGISGVPGSLGATNIQGNIAGEISDIGPASMATGNSSNNGQTTYSVTVTAYGQTSTTAGSTSRGTEQLRARLQVVSSAPNSAQSCH